MKIVITGAGIGGLAVALSRHVSGETDLRFYDRVSTPTSSTRGRH